MLSGPFARLTVWTPSLLLLLLVMAPISTIASSLDDEIAMLADEASRLRAILPALGLPEPAPGDLTDLARSSPAKARVAFDQAKIAFVKAAELELKKEIFLVGQSIESSKTTAANYPRRRQLLAELEAMFRARRQPVVGLFPEGPPSSRLAQGNFGDKEFAYCDKSFAYLGSLFKVAVQQAMAAGGVNFGSSSGSGGDVAAPPDGTPPPAVDSTGIGGEPSDTPLQAGNRGHTMSVIAMYFTWCLYFIAGIALLGLLYHLKQGATSFSDLTTTAIKSYGDGTEDLPISAEDPAQTFKDALSAFQKNRYTKALAGFQTVAATTHHDRDRALFYIVLCELRLGDVAAAATDFERIPKEALSAEEYYRLGSGFEEAGALNESLRMYEAVKAEDETFRDVLHRINVIERKRTDAPGGGD